MAGPKGNLPILGCNVLAIRARVRAARILFWGAEYRLQAIRERRCGSYYRWRTVSMPSRRPEAQALAAGPGQHETARPGVP